MRRLCGTKRVWPVLRNTGRDRQPQLISRLGRNTACAVLPTCASRPNAGNKSHTNALHANRFSTQRLNCWVTQKQSSFQRSQTLHCGLHTLSEKWGDLCTRNSRPGSRSASTFYCFTSFLYKNTFWTILLTSFRSKLKPTSSPTQKACVWMPCVCIGWWWMLKLGLHHIFPASSPHPPTVYIFVLLFHKRIAGCCCCEPWLTIEVTGFIHLLRTRFPQRRLLTNLASSPMRWQFWTDFAFAFARAHDV